MYLCIISSRIVIYFSLSKSVFKFNKLLVNSMKINVRIKSKIPDSLEYWWRFRKHIDNALKQGFSNCGSRNKLAFCAFKIGFFTIIFIDNQKLKEVTCHCLLLKVSRHLSHLIDKKEPNSP